MLPVSTPLTISRERKADARSDPAMSSNRHAGSTGPTVTRYRLPAFLLVFTAFVVLSPVVLLAFGLFSIRTYFVACFLWLLIASEVFVPSDPAGSWWARLRWLKLVGWVILAIVVFERVTAVI